jgi:ribosomal protein L16/L10AE
MAHGKEVRGGTLKMLCLKLTPERAASRGHYRHWSQSLKPRTLLYEAAAHNSRTRAAAAAAAAAATHLDYAPNN